MKLLSISMVMSSIVLSACTIQSTPKPRPNTSNEMLNLINQARSQARQCGGRHFQAAPPLRWNDALARAAQKHAQDMADNNYFEHKSRDGHSPFDRMKAEGYRYMSAAENIAQGNRNAQDAVNGWLTSAGHCANIMNPNFREVGMAVAHNKAMYVATPRIYWVQNFAAPR